MLVTVWRHGEAHPGSPDRERVLTERGSADLSRGAPGYVRELARRGLVLPDRLLYSRWERTRQTAGHILDAIPGSLPSAEDDSLIPGRDPEDVEAALAPLSEASPHILLVSHQPLVSDLIDRWLGRQGEVPPLSPGAYAVLDLSFPAAGCATVCWWSAPPEYAV
jgi:phosphohistidine phosphatase